MVGNHGLFCWLWLRDDFVVTSPLRKDTTTFYLFYYLAKESFTSFAAHNFCQICFELCLLVLERKKEQVKTKLRMTLIPLFNLLVAYTALKYGKRLYIYYLPLILWPQ